MLEKDIENLIAAYPEEFLPYRNLKLIGQQVRLGTYFADIIFQDEFQTKIVIEVKRGILSREAVAQIMDYYGLIKNQEKDTDVKLLIVANVIPKQRTIFLSEKLGIEFIEIPASKIINVAKEHSYLFLDEIKPEIKSEYLDKTIKIDKEVSVGGSNVWIFQANPKTYDILNALSSKEELGEENDMWSVSRFKDRIHKGDTALIWMSSTSPKSNDAGIYAVAEITSNPEYMKSTSKFWISEDDFKKQQNNLWVRLKYKLIFANNPIFREELKSIDELKNMLIFKQPQGTNFPVTQEEWRVISDLIKKRIQE
ncbi:MAG: endonuclease NucS [Candidatus Thermoplasmatota archaeon]|nr:endonuclease NucS [Candidatus Thermoplasmatota archaeon]